jgi:hypothetical protein
MISPQPTLLHGADLRQAFSFVGEYNMDGWLVREQSKARFWHTAVLLTDSRAVR